MDFAGPEDCGSSVRKSMYLLYEVGQIHIKNISFLTKELNRSFVHDYTCRYAKFIMPLAHL